MALTINSNYLPYCTPAQFVILYDWRVFAELASDTDVPLANAAALVASPVLADCLQVGAGDIEGAVTIGQRYQPADLVSLVAPNPLSTPPNQIANSGWMLIRMNAALGAKEMYDRRFQAIPDDIQKRVDVAMEKLAALEAGTMIFAFTETQEAGVIHDYQEHAQDVVNRQLPSYIASPVFGIRANRSNPNLGA